MSETRELFFWCPEHGKQAKKVSTTEEVYTSRCPHCNREIYLLDTPMTEYQSRAAREVPGLRRGRVNHV